MASLYPAEVMKSAQNIDVKDKKIIPVMQKPLPGGSVARHEIIPCHISEKVNTAFNRNKDMVSFYPAEVMKSPQNIDVKDKKIIPVMQKAPPDDSVPFCCELPFPLFDRDMLTKKEQDEDFLEDLQWEFQQMEEQLKEQQEDLQDEFKQMEEQLKEQQEDLQDEFEQMEEQLKEQQEDLQDEFKQMEEQLKEQQEDLQDEFKQMEEQLKEQQEDLQDEFQQMEEQLKEQQEDLQYELY
ncbi:zinc finger protein 853-like isoform X2 [Alosa sapidissima]|uniref:zinc finger protein 853-like isoform X2 n=1 Tax=Alosa sapidissima TaxID=34773 RepID=UPI001C09A38D|nr:zinc finger protein 853-like isoform X2 [Alosa sapidissima]